MRFIGDVHGKMGDYLHITDGCAESIQVGDFGAGFVPLPSLDLRHRFIRGNHDRRKLFPDQHTDGIAPKASAGGGMRTVLNHCCTPASILLRAIGPTLSSRTTVPGPYCPPCLDRTRITISPAVPIRLWMPCLICIVRGCGSLDIITSACVGTSLAPNLSAWLS